MRPFLRPRLLIPVVALTAAAAGIGTAAAKPADPTSPDDPPVDGCRIEFADPSDSADERRARAACEAARARFTELFGEPAPAARVVLVVVAVAVVPPTLGGRNPWSLVGVPVLLLWAVELPPYW